MILLAFAVVVVLLVAPHLLDLRRLAPVTAAVIWGSALTLRASLVAGAGAYMAVFLPPNELFGAVTHSCWHTILPLVSVHMGLSDHVVADVAIALPVLALVISLLLVGHGVIRAARAVSSLLRREALGPGPAGSVILGGREVVLAAAGVRRPRVVVSAGALTALDDDELAAGLEHERAHIDRHHRFVLVYAELCRAFARFLPGTSRAMNELRFHLERDADACALRRDHHPYALAGAICKAAGAAPPTGAVAYLGWRGGAGERLRQLLDAPGGRGGAGAIAAVALAVLMATAAIGTIAVLPVAVASGHAASLSEQIRHVQGLTDPCTAAVLAAPDAAGSARRAPHGSL